MCRRALKPRFLHLGKLLTTLFMWRLPNGDLYVSSDGCGSLGRDADRGRVLRLRDKDGDGRADEVTEFIASIDSPRG